MTDLSKKQDAADLLQIDKDAQGILRVTLNDPARRNALSEAMLDRLGAILADAAIDASVRVIILAAIGPAFCAGHDLKEMRAGRADADQGEAYFTDVLKRCSAVMQAILQNPKPVIAEVATTATAAGCQLVASCDLAYAAPSAKFSTPGVHIGLFCSTPMVALSRNVGAKHAMEMLLTGEMVPAARAAEIGLVNAVVDDADLTDHVTAVAHKIARKSPVTLAIGKSAFYTQRELSIADAYEYASRVMVENMLHRDAVEGIDAFIEKREPKW
ncbi:enoyl-CoA hydratase [Alphaproteobacteria bacterium]|nr:enoyl-CoA hydratase [Alphaproteobacteria bacterium]